MKKSVSVTLALLVGVAIGATLPVTRAQSPGGERTAWYFYRVTWGHQEEFVELFKKNHYPVLKEQMGDRFQGLRAHVPRRRPRRLDLCNRDRLQERREIHFAFG